MPKSKCNFLESLAHKNAFIRPVTRLAMEYVMKNPGIRADRYFLNGIREAGLKMTDDEKKLLLIEFMSLVDAASGELEQRYLESIVSLDDEEIMITQLADFIENAKI